MSIPDEVILREYRRRKALSPDASTFTLEFRTALALHVSVERVRETLDFHNAGLSG